jgi:hypothetical protein
VYLCSIQQEPLSLSCRQAGSCWLADSVSVRPSLHAAPLPICDRPPHTAAAVQGPYNGIKDQQTRRVLHAVRSSRHVDCQVRQTLLMRQPAKGRDPVSPGCHFNTPMPPCPCHQFAIIQCTSDMLAGMEAWSHAQVVCRPSEWGMVCQSACLQRHMLIVPSCNVRPAEQGCMCMLSCCCRSCRRW